MKRLKLYFIADPKVNDDPDGALAIEAKIIKDHIVIKDINDLIHRVIQNCVKRKGLVGAMVIASHGNSYTFDIGSNTVGIGDLRLPTLSVLRPWFAPDAYLIINACECGNSQELLRQVAKILGVTVVAYTGMVDVYKWLFYEGIVPRGNTVVCTASGCREINHWEEARKKMLSGPGDDMPGFARDG
ncbi:MAG: DUF4347 domain-containing protein [Saprospiraceae bacterium]|nr:DUF4347 domain-containing protein [Pyrinomonadaceae bacterium]